MYKLGLKINKIIGTDFSQTQMDIEQTNILKDLPSENTSEKNLNELRKHYEEVKMHSLDLLTKIEYMKKTSS